MHTTANHLIETLDGHTASGIVFSIVEAATIASNMRAVVYCADDYAKQNGRWKFRSRVIHPLLPCDTQAFAKAKLDNAI